MQEVDKLRQRLIDRQMIFELVAPPSYKDFLQILIVQHLCFYFNLLAVQKVSVWPGNSMF